jgi:DNA-binding NarL/FixJ family response regulator
MNAQALDAHEAFEAAKNSWYRQMIAYRQSVTLFREVSTRRTRRLHNAPRALPVTTDRAPMTPSVDRATRPALVVLSRVDSASSERCPLTRRQVDVVRLVAQGFTNDQIARELVLTSGTVANHAEHILRRLGAPNRAAAAAWMARELPGLLDDATD